MLWTLRALLHPESLPQNVICSELFVIARRDEFAEIETRVLAPLRREFSLPSDELSKSENASREYSRPVLKLIEGSATRQSSVLAGASVATGDFVLVHDAARPLISPQLCAQVVAAALECGAAIAAEAARDTVKIARQTSPHDARVLAPQIEKTITRDKVFLAQTPQVFRRELLLRALQTAQRDDFSGTDCASLVERLEDAPPIALISDGSFNLKVTRREDFAVSEFFLSAKHA